MKQNKIEVEWCSHIPKFPDSMEKWHGKLSAFEFQQVYGFKPSQARERAEKLLDWHSNKGVEKYVAMVDRERD